jgi:CDGSH-type Zn-finger protein/uncharacterized Fe-S cluster protein YjdI
VIITVPVLTLRGAKEPLMKKKVYDYEGSQIKVTFDLARCIHAEECVHGLPRVFDRDRRPWIDPGQAGAEEIAEVVLRCPTGALKSKRLDGGAAESLPEKNTVTLDPDGPLYLEGDIEVADSEGTVLLKDTRVALCRCGASKNKPLCDGRHTDAGFQHPGNLGELTKRTEPDEGSRTLTVTPLENGPLLLDGPVEIIDATGAENISSGNAALCRCGSSGNKPFCDGTHKKVGFVSSK